MLTRSSPVRRSPPARWLIFASAAAGGVFVVILLLVLTGGPPSEQAAAKRFVGAWATGDFAAMHAELSPTDQRALPLRSFIERYRAAATTATATRFAHGEVGGVDDGVVAVPMTVTTRIFGTLRATLRLRFTGEGDDKRVAWSPSMVFPGLKAGEQLARSTQLPRRADILARNGSPLAQGQDRTSPIADVASSIIGELGPPEPDRVARLRELGYPEDARVGTSGLEKVFEERVAGRPGGELRAGSRTLARTQPRPATAVHSSIDPEVQRAAVAAKGEYLGGVAAVRPRTG
ncbi:MAG TPA: NTF2-like N-terminal transpeptidase domain-containing protein, partial [Solirubrobacteraceae bacterium]